MNQPGIVWWVRYHRTSLQTWGPHVWSEVRLQLLVDSISLVLCILTSIQANCVSSNCTDILGRARVPKTIFKTEVGNYLSPVFVSMRICSKKLVSGAKYQNRLQNPNRRYTIKSSATSHLIPIFSIQQPRASNLIHSTLDF